MHRIPFNCYIIGDDSLVAKCGKVILQNGGTISGLFSPDIQNIEWAISKKIHVFSIFSEFEQAVSNSRCDYLFSISNKKILSDVIINAPIKMAINYHNAPLPKYGGTYATLWAILNEEKSHGITWHIMTDKIDAGDILEQIRFPIDVDDTMTTLNTKCHEYAIRIFEELVHKIAFNRIETKKQKKKVEYYSLNRRVKNDSFIIWSNTAKKIYTLYRALNSYPYLNQIGLPKLLIDDTVFIPRSLEMMSETSRNKPGTVINLSDNFIEVATVSQNIKITKLLHLDGKEFPIANLKNILAIKENKSFPIISKLFLNKLEEHDKNCFNHESFWVKKLSSVQSLELPYFANFKLKKLAKDKTISFGYNLNNIFKLQIVKKFLDNFKMGDFIYILFLLYLYRINNYKPFSIGYTDNNIQNLTQDSKHIYANIVPMNIDFHIRTKKIEDLLYLLQNELSIIRNNKTYKRDVFLRYPSLNDKFPKFYLILDINNSLSTIEQSHESLIISLQEKNQRLMFTANKYCLTEPELGKIVFLMMSHIKTWLKAIEINPNTPIVNLPILTKKECRWFLKNCRGKTIDYENADYIDEIIEKHSVIEPSRTALILNNRTLSYYNLNAMASYLANSLYQNGIREGNIVAISLEDNIYFIIAILAIIKVGAIYLPLDPAYPDINLNFMLNDSKASLLITNAKLKNRLTNQYGNILCFNEGFFPTNYDTKKQYGNKVKEKLFSHIIYTSGSTGNPKGVIISRKNIINSLNSRIYYYDQVTKLKYKSINLLLLLSTSFDTAIAAIFWPLICGAKLTMLDPYSIKDINKIINVIKNNNITHIICVSSLYQIILDMADKGDLNSLRVVIIGGDQSGNQLVEMHKIKAANSYLFNEYGITEGTIWSTVKKIYDAKTQKTEEITIGWPAPNTNIYVLDKYMQLVPNSVVGELFLGGNNIAHGYINHKELNKEKFIVYNCILGVKDRLYKTGDLSRYCEHGLEFQGRIDAQVKIRGFRIEPYQIEKTITQYQNIKQCIVVDKIIDTKKHLVAYIVQNDPNIKLDRTRLVNYLMLKIPSYMIPSFFITILVPPLTGNNKIDKNKLPLPDKQRIANESYSFQYKHKNNTEKQLAELWKKVLKLDNISITDNFFVLGGHSLLISELLLHIKKQFNVDIKIQKFLELPTIKNLAMLIDGVSSDVKMIKPFTTDFSRDVLLDKKIIPLVMTPLDKKPGAILLTGVTGFLGSFLLQKIYQYTNADIYCLIRDKDDIQAKKRLQQSITSYKLNLDLSRTKRITTIASDLSLPRLGLSPDFFNYLSKKIDLIYHNAAYVHHLYNYNVLRATNVLSTIEMIKLACTGKSKKIHYISTMSAALEIGSDNKIKESFPNIDNLGNLYIANNGYVQTKIASEILLTQAKERGIFVNIYRPTWILWPSKAKRIHIQNNHLLQLIIGCIQLGYAPDWDMILNVWPVNILSDYLVQISLSDIDKSKMFNFYNINIVTWKDLIDKINSNCQKIQLVSQKKWLKHYVKNIKQDNALFPLLSFYLSNSDITDSMLNMSPANVERINVEKSLEKLGLKYPDTDVVSLVKCLM